MRVNMIAMYEGRVLIRLNMVAMYEGGRKLG